MHIGFGPQVVEQFIMGNEPAGIFDQVRRMPNCLGGKRDLRALAPEALVLGIQPERLELFKAGPQGKGFDSVLQAGFHISASGRKGYLPKFSRVR